MASISVSPARARLQRPRAVGFLAAALLLTGISYGLAGTGPPSLTPPATAQPAAIDISPGTAEAASGSIAQIDHSIQAWAHNLAAEPRDFLSATTLAALYYTRGRLSGDLADDQRALEAARTATQAAPTEPGSRLVEAAVRNTLHDFAGALQIAQSVYRGDPSQLGALATLADAELELGRIDAAKADLATLGGRASGPSVDIRLARLAFVTGSSADAVRLARAARDAAAANPSTSPIDLGFYDYAAGEYARLAGEVASARAGYEAALAIRDTDIAALVGLARIDDFEGRTSAAAAGLAKAVAIAPQPEILGLLGDLLVASGDSAAARDQFATVRFIERLGQIQSTVFDRVLMRFELDHGGASGAVLASARASLAARPDTTGHDLVAWALFRLGRYPEAAAEIRAARANGADDGRLRYHDGAIALALGERTDGRSLLESALALGPALDPIERAEATRLLAGG